MNIEDYSRKQKIELIKKIQEGALHIINGEIIGGPGVVLEQRGDEYFLNDKPVDIDKIEQVVETLIILPAKNKETN